MSIRGSYNGAQLFYVGGTEIARSRHEMRESTERLEPCITEPYQIRLFVQSEEWEFLGGVSGFAFSWKRAMKRVYWSRRKFINKALDIGPPAFV